MVNLRLLLLLMLLGFSGYSKAMEEDDGWGDSQGYVALGAPTMPQQADVDPEARFFQIHNKEEFHLYARLLIEGAWHDLGIIPAGRCVETERPTYKSSILELFTDPEYKTKFGQYPVLLEHWRLSGLRRLVIRTTEKEMQGSLEPQRFHVRYEHDFTGRQCPICWDRIEPEEDVQHRGELGENVWILDCGHVFHYSCMTEALRQQRVCPTCRKPVGVYFRSRQGAGTTRAAKSTTLFDLNNNLFVRLRIWSDQ